jgi:serine/threonine-protein kinase
MAVVYKAEDAILGRTVALKTLHERYAESPSFRRRFTQEARAMACLDHENIIKVYDISQEGEVPFIVAECVAGRDIGKLLLAANRGGTLNEKFARRLAAQLLRALSYAHRRGVIHRDIKPSNILVTAAGIVKVADFGIARILEDDGADVGKPGEIVGSARYMSPEQLRGEEATPRSDVYSVGVLLYHCLTGRPPFSGGVRALAQQHLHKSPTPPRKLNRKISPQMEAVILKALAKDPSDRYPSATAMLDDVDVEVRPRSVKTAEVPRSGAGGRRRGLILAASAAALLVALAGAALATGLGPANLPLTDRAGEERALSRDEPIEPGEPPPAPEPSREPAPTEDSSREEQAASAASSAEASAEASERLVRVPDVRAFYDYFAEETLTGMGFEVRFVYDYQRGYASRGVTWATDPAIGTLAPRGSTITVYATPEDYPQPQL